MLSFILLLSWVICIFWIILELFLSSSGYEDKEGFHYGQPPEIEVACDHNAAEDNFKVL